MKKRKHKTSYRKKKNVIYPFLLFIVLLFLFVFISKNILNDIKTSISINTLKNSTINYTDKNDTIITVNKKNTDLKMMDSNSGYDFKIYRNDTSEKYKIKVTIIDKNIDSKYIKFYLTNNSKKLKPFLNSKRLTELEYDNGYILYTNVLNKKSESFNLKAWISDECKKEKGYFSYKIEIVSE